VFAGENDGKEEERKKFPKGARHLWETFFGLGQEGEFVV